MLCCRQDSWCTQPLACPLRKQYGRWSCKANAACVLEDPGEMKSIVYTWQSQNMLQITKRAHPISISPKNLRGIGIQGGGSRHERGVIRRIRGLPDQSSCSQSRSHGGCQIGSPHIIPCNVVGPVQGVVLRPAPVVLVGGVVTHLHACIHSYI